MKSNILLVGLGPHSKRIYLKYLKNKYKSLYLLELKSKVEDSRSYLDNNGFKDVSIINIDDKYKDYDELPKHVYNELLHFCQNNYVDKIIVSTEPKAHHMYLKFALENNIDVLCDKPIIVLKEMNKKKNINKMRKEYYDLLRLYNKSTSQCKIMCQRLYHKGYIYVKNILKDVVRKYNVPITYIDIYHCDGNWEFPHDLDKENHPYKYGYGKLYHSGFHFIDLLAELIKINESTTYNKRIVKGYLQGNKFTPNDELAVFNKKDYNRIFPDSLNNSYYQNLDKIEFNNFGEKNIYCQMYFYNNKNKLITTANLNLLHYGVSRRGWFESKDYYKNNGRIRHEKININVGTLLNIQITSCQSKEIKDRTNKIDEIYEGGLEHFDIDIYRNVDIIGGKPHEKIKLYDLYNENMNSKDFIGFNEKSRDDCINAFLNNSSNLGEIDKEKLGMELLYSESQIMCNKSFRKKNLIKIKIPNQKERQNYIDIITDKDFGIKPIKFKKPRIRIASRGIIYRDDGKVAIFNKSFKNEYKLPGGGCENDENIRDSFIREALEETGCNVEIINELGIIKEEKSQDNFIQLSYVYVAKVINDIHKLSLTPKEMDEGGKIIWVTIDDAIKLINDCYDKIKPSKYENLYHSRFIVLRDKKILDYYMKELKVMSSDKKWNDLYKKYINTEYDNFEKYFQIKMKLKRKFLNEVIKYSKNKPVLECGCGTGKSAVYLAQKGIESYGMDLEKEMVEETNNLSKKLCPQNPVKTILGNINKIPYKNKYFSVTHSSGVLEHYSDEEIIAFINEQLRVSDICIFSVPTKYFDKKMLGNERFMTRKEWINIINKSNAKIIKKFGYHYKTFGKRIIDILKNPKKLFKPIALYGFILESSDKK